MDGSKISNPRESLVDVGEGDGTMAKAIFEAYPKLNVMVFDLPHVVGMLQGNGGNLTYVSGHSTCSSCFTQGKYCFWVFESS